MADLTSELQRAAKEILRQMTSHHLFFFSRAANRFEPRFREAYKTLRGQGLQIAEQIIHAESLPHEDHASIVAYHEDLRNFRFDACERKSGMHNNGEVKVKCESNVRERSVDVVHFTPPIVHNASGPNLNDALMELFLICDMLNRAGAECINVYAPFIPYQREDKKDEGRVPIAGKLVFDFLDRACAGKLGRIVTVDLHAPQEQGFASGPVDNFSMVSTFARYLVSEKFHRKFPIEPSDLTILSPDATGAKRAKKLADLLGIKYLVFDDKSRPDVGEVAYDESRVYTITTPYAAYIDDMIDTAGTICESAKLAFGKYGLKQVFALASHGIFSPKYKEDGTLVSIAEDLLRESKLKVITTDSVPRDPAYYSANKDWLVDVISIADPLAHIALSTRLGHSVSDWMKSLEDEVKMAVTERRKLKMDGYLIAA